MLVWGDKYGEGRLEGKVFVLMLLNIVLLVKHKQDYLEVIEVERKGMLFMNLIFVVGISVFH